MATLISSLGACVSRMTSGERRLSESCMMHPRRGIPLLKPVSCGRDGQAPIIIKLPTLRDEAAAIADHLASAHQEGFAWGDMAVLCADSDTRDLCARTLAQRRLPVENRLRSGDFDPTSNKIKVMTMKVSKGLEFPVVALPGVGHMPGPGEDEKEAARVFYVAATRATQRLVIAANDQSKFGMSLNETTSLKPSCSP